MVSAVVLAAGLSTRMGEHKMLLKLGDGQGLLQRVLLNISGARFSEIILVTGRDALAIGVETRDFDLSTVHNSNFANGLSTSIATGVKSVSPSSRGIALCLGDMPMITAKEYDILIREFVTAFDRNVKAIVAPSFEGRRGNPVIFSSAYRDGLVANENPDGCKPIVMANREHLREVEMETGHVLVDVDTPEDLGLIGSR